jgi:triosephosphate isomerase
MGRKVRAALDNDLLPIYCVGETLDERKGGRTERVLKRHLETGLEKIRPEDTHRLTIAYEPVWAIGTGETATGDQVALAHRTIRKCDEPTCRRNGGQPDPHPSTAAA